MQNINRSKRFNFRATEEEATFIKEKFKASGLSNLSDYLRKMSMLGFILQFDDDELKKMQITMSNIASNINQIARRSNSTHNIYAEDIEEKICSQFSTVGVANNAAVVFLWTAVYERMDCMFGERAYRYIYLDAGHVCQNLYLAAQTMHIKVCALGAFDDEVLNQNLGFDGENQFVVYGAGVGK